jgi:hypothetical protein
VPLDAACVQVRGALRTCSVMTWPAHHDPRTMIPPRMHNASLAFGR